MIIVTCILEFFVLATLPFTITLFCLFHVRTKKNNFSSFSPSSRYGSSDDDASSSTTTSDKSITRESSGVDARKNTPPGPNKLSAPSPDDHNSSTGSDNSLSEQNQEKSVYFMTTATEVKKCVNSYYALPPPKEKPVNEREIFSGERPLGDIPVKRPAEPPLREATKPAVTPEYKAPAPVYVAPKVEKSVGPEEKIVKPKVMQQKASSMAIVQTGQPSMTGSQKAPKKPSYYLSPTSPNVSLQSTRDVREKNDNDLDRSTKKPLERDHERDRKLAMKALQRFKNRSGLVDDSFRLRSKFTAQAPTYVPPGQKKFKPISELDEPPTLKEKRRNSKRVVRRAKKSKPKETKK